MTVIARFAGDPTGYDVTRRGEIDDLHDAREVARSLDAWVAARVGITREVVLVNLALAYLLEQKDERPPAPQPDPF